ncbi:MAG: glucokinase [Desulfobulbaceae bacterium]
MTGNSRCILAGDVGASKTSLALYDPAAGPLAPLATVTVANASAPALEDIIENFLLTHRVRPASACLGIAGPVVDNRVRMTNLNWTLDGQVLQQQFGLQQVTLINDLVATAMGSVHLPPDRLHTINQGQPDPLGALAVIAPGTGLGEAFLIRRHQRLYPYPSEGGHCTFAPTDEQQIRLLRFLAAKQGHVSTEQVCSGMAIPTLYRFLCAEHPDGQGLGPLPDADRDPGRAIITEALTALARGDAEQNLATATLKLFCAILAAEAANLVLKVLATGGLFIGGGIPPRIIPFLHATPFMSRFCRGVYEEMLCSVPVHVILEPQTALIGAAAYGIASLQETGQ